ncbi:MAG: aldehyde ferredoxin oxidoreductase [Candidatus Lokiarchaeota archaeon]|nr:aldehyde ferredoxin oxidoreductase [Candidatus Lokiarchaeota archaeon]MBD3199862.1 aldehyde ferredoxin oxidoreductase [Candidatus Lokiarchaeota archaeon]
MYGYFGKLLKIDLTQKSTEILDLDEQELRSYLGGTSLAAKLMYDDIDPDIDPLSAENPLVFSVGPLTGSGFPMSSRSAVCAISPLTKIWGEATTGGVFPIKLKATGFDAIYIIGKSQVPIYIKIHNDKIEFKDAKKLWGLDIYECQKLIREELNDKKIAISCIGKAGENLVRISSIMNDEGRAAGRCGLGAIMGSKNLKAIVVSGTSRVEFAQRKNVLEMAKELTIDIKNDPGVVAMRELGTNQWLDAGMYMADVPAKYFTKSVFPAQKISGIAFREKYSIQNYACAGCPIGCGRRLLNYGNDNAVIDGPEYETVAAFGPLVMNFDKDVIIKANHLCNKEGIDTISTGVIISYVMYLYEQKVLTKENSGMEIKWGDGETILKLIEMIVNRQGIGELLSKGTREIARELGRDEEETAQVKGLELPMHDVRAFHVMSLIYATSPRGACHNKGDYYLIDFFSDGIQEYKITMGDRFKARGKARKAIKLQSFREVFDSLTLCKFSSVSPTEICNFLIYLTGWDINPDELLEIGDRSINLKRAINNRLGITRENDKIPNHVLKPLNEGSSRDKVPNINKLLTDYYKKRSWDWETGKPTKKALKNLNLDFLIKDLWNNENSELK